MADEQQHSRTEAPTQRRREQASEEGQSAVSADLATGLLLLAAVALLSMGAQALSSGLLNSVHEDLIGCRRVQDLAPDGVQKMFVTLFGRGVDLIGFLLGFLFLVGVGAGVLQAGF